MKKAGKSREPGRIRGDSGQHTRIFLTALVLGLYAFVPIVIQLYGLMIRDYDYYLQKARDNQTRTTAVQADRGCIYDRNYHILACSEGVQSVYLNPRQLRACGADLEQVAEFLAQQLAQDPQAILEKARNMTMRYQTVATAVSQADAQAIREFSTRYGIRGIQLEPATKRVYPYGSLAAQVIGFVNASGAGSEGIEAAYDSYLRGGTDRVITGTGNLEMEMPFAYQAYLAEQKGCDVTLTLDVTVQACLEKQLSAAIARYDVQNGAFGLVMDVNTGEILAMATLGSYDPNAYLQIADSDTQAALDALQAKYQAYAPDSQAYQQGKQAYQKALQEARLSQWRNRCISDGYEPGSTFKVLTLAAALDSGAITLENTYSCSGTAHIPGRSQLLHCWRSTGHGGQTTAQALQNSCNIAFANIALSLGGERFYRYVEAFGILEKTGIDLYGESKGVFFEKTYITDTQKWGTASLTSGSFGQTFKLTPLQLVRAIAAVVNGGYLVEPYVVSQVTDSQGNILLSQEPTVLRQVIEEETSQTMCRLLKSVVDEGTAKNAQVAGFSIGGKTGTSEKVGVLDENGNPTLDKIVSFVGVAPMDDPQYIVLVALDTPSRATGLYISGGVMAAPTVGAVMADILPYLGVARQTEQTVTVPDVTGMTAQQALECLQKAGLTAVCLGTQQTVTHQLPAPGAQAAPRSQALLYLGEEARNRQVTVPDFTGMDRKTAVETAGALGLFVGIQGNPALTGTVVTVQSHPKDTQVASGTTIELTFTDLSSRD